MRIVTQKRTAIINVDNVQMIGLAKVSDGRAAVRAGNLRGTETQTLGTYRDIETATEVLLQIARMNERLCFGMPPEDWTPETEKPKDGYVVTLEKETGGGE